MRTILHSRQIEKLTKYVRSSHGFHHADSVSMKMIGTFGSPHPIKSAVMPTHLIFLAESPRHWPVRKSAVITAATATRHLASEFSARYIQKQSGGEHGDR